MKNVTIALDDELASWARVEAARQGKSLSRYLADKLAADRGVRLSQSDALAKLRAMPLLPLTDVGEAPDRDQLRERHGLR